MDGGRLGYRGNKKAGHVLEALKGGSTLVSEKQLRVAPLTCQHDDTRRSVYEVLCGISGIVRVTHLAVKDKAILGNHFHRNLTETFILVSGTALLFTQKVASDGRAREIMRWEKIEAPCIIEMPPLTVHAFSFTGPAILISLGDTPFDREDQVPYTLFD